MAARRIFLLPIVVVLVFISIVGSVRPSLAFSEGAAGDGGVKDGALVRCINTRLAGQATPLSGDHATPNQIAAVSNLNCNNYGIHDLSGFEQFNNIRGYLHLDGNPISSLEPIARIITISDLSVAHANITSLKPLWFLALKYLNVEGNYISDFPDLLVPDSIISINADDNKITSVKAISRFSNLEKASFKNNEVSEISSLRVPVNLHYLDLSENNISGIENFDLVNQKLDLFLQGNHVHDASPLRKISWRSDSSINLSGQKIESKMVKAGKSSKPDVIDFQGGFLSENGHIAISPRDGVGISSLDGTITYPHDGIYEVKIDNGKSCDAASQSKCYSVAYSQEVGLPLDDREVWLHPNGGEGAHHIVKTNSAGTVSLAGESFNKEDYILTGWNTKADGSGERYELDGLVSPQTERIDLYAQWKFDTRPVYKLYYDANGGEGAPAPEKIRSEVPHTISEIMPTRDGYDFTGWNTQKDGSGASLNPENHDQIITNTSIGDTTLYAQWKKFFTLTYDANGGKDAHAPEKIYPAEKYQIPGDKPSRSGYEFLNWNTEKDGSGTIYQVYPWYHPFSYDYIETKDITKDITLYAQWKSNDTVLHDVTYDANGGIHAPYDDRRHYSGDRVTIPAEIPEFSGHRFLGWKESDGKIIQPGMSFTMPNSDVKLVAEWSSAYKVIYKAPGAQNVPSDSRDYAEGDVVKISDEIPVWAGHEFTGWKKSDGIILQPQQTFSMSDKDAELLAQWKQTPPPTSDPMPTASSSQPRPSAPTLPPTPTQSPTSEPAPSPNPSVAPAQTPEPSVTPQSTAKPAPDSDQSSASTSGPASGSSPSPTPASTSEASGAPELTPRPGPAPSATPGSTPSPMPGPAPTPPTPAPEQTQVFPAPIPPTPGPAPVPPTPSPTQPSPAAIPSTQGPEAIPTPELSPSFPSASEGEPKPGPTPDSDPGTVPSPTPGPDSGQASTTPGTDAEKAPTVPAKSGSSLATDSGHTHDKSHTGIHTEDQVPTAGPTSTSNPTSTSSPTSGSDSSSTQGRIPGHGSEPGATAVPSPGLTPISDSGQTSGSNSTSGPNPMSDPASKSSSSAISGPTASDSTVQPTSSASVMPDSVQEADKSGSTGSHDGAGNTDTAEKTDIARKTGSAEKATAGGAKAGTGGDATSSSSLIYGLLICGLAVMILGAGLCAIYKGKIYKGRRSQP